MTTSFLNAEPPGGPSIANGRGRTHRRVDRRRSGAGAPEPDRGILSTTDWRRPPIRVLGGGLHVVLLILLIIAGLLPLLWLLKSAVTPTQDTLTQPLALFPHGIDWSNLSKAWNDVHIGDFFFNTIAMAAGEWAVQLLVATTGGFVLSVLRPKYAKFVSGLVLATLFVPAVVLLVPLYLTILHPPVIGVSMINTYWAVWLPAGASAFNVLLVMRFFDSLPREVFEAAQTDGAGTFRLFFSVVLPMSKPILGVVSVFAITAAWADFLWPNLVLTDISVQPLSVRLPQIQSSTDLGVYLAALAIATLIPVVIFLIFQRTFLSGGGLGGAVKG
ncbi:carbohydrate ABC transporter permease [Rathayibacter soli]|uniref:carbohydrate ABC transporter permease n=1 Tax=Rathayibacter soli TaxID=3144168 RepID=UPI0039082EE9